jgi:hypothetical protein
MREVNQAPHLGAKLFDITKSLEVLESIIVQANPIYDHYLRLHGQEIALELSRVDAKLDAILKGIREAAVVPVPAGSTDDGVPPQFC